MKRVVMILTQDDGEMKNVGEICPKFFDDMIANRVFKSLQEAEDILEVLRSHNTAFRLERTGRLSDEEKQALKKVLELQKIPRRRR